MFEASRNDDAQERVLSNSEPSMSFPKAWTLTLLAGIAALATTGTANATDRSVGTARKARPAAGQVDDALSLSSRPDLYAGKPVRVFCERMRNPDQGAMNCRADGVSIVVDTRLFSSETLRHAFDNCRGMTSACSATVSGVVEYTNGVTRIVKAEADFLED